MAVPHLDRYALAAGGIILGGFLLALSPCGVRPYQARLEAVRRARTIAIALRDYSFETKRVPVEGLEVLSREGYVPEQVLVDPWKRRFELRVRASGEAEVVSLGADGVAGGTGEAADIVVPVTRLDR